MPLAATASVDTNRHIDPRAQIANAACAAIGAASGAWMVARVLPVEPELTMSDAAYDAAFCHQFLLNNDRLVHGAADSESPAATAAAGPYVGPGLRPTDLTPSDLPFSEHVTALACIERARACQPECRRLPGAPQRSPALRPATQQLFVDAQYEFDTTPAHLRFPA